MIVHTVFMLFVDFTNLNETILRDNWSVIPVEYRFCNVLPLLLRPKLNTPSEHTQFLNQLLSELNNE